MELSLGTRFKKAWNTFRNRDPTEEYTITSAENVGQGSWRRPDRPIIIRGNEKTIVSSICNRISLDVASLDIKHCILDENDRFKETKNSNLNSCLTVEANIDQTAQSFKHDLVITMLEEGVAAIVPVDTTLNPNLTDSYDILTMRVGKIVQWYPKHVKVRVYNDRTGNKEDILLQKRCVGIIENPLYAVMNEPNSTMKRLIRKLALLDVIDEQSGSGKLDLVVQLPYLVKGKSRKAQAEERRKDLEEQLSDSKYGIAYIDGTEKIVQLNRSVENNLMKQIEYLTPMLYSQLGITQSILDGSANEQEMLNYYTRTIEPIATEIVSELNRKFLTKTARTQKQTIMYFRDPFKLVPVNNIAEISDKFTRNEIMSSNEIRQIIGMKPSEDPKADQLINSNISQSSEEMDRLGLSKFEERGENQNGEI